MKVKMLRLPAKAFRKFRVPVVVEMADLCDDSRKHKELWHKLDELYLLQRLGIGLQDKRLTPFYRKERSQ